MYTTPDLSWMAENADWRQLAIMIKSMEPPWSGIRVVLYQVSSDSDPFLFVIFNEGN